MHNPFGHHHPETQQPYQAPYGIQYPQPIHGEIVKIYCEANSDFFLDGRNSNVLVTPESRKCQISPILGLGASQGVHPPRGEQNSFYPPQANVEPQGHTVVIHCKAHPEFFLAARGDVAVLALENPHDPHQQWIKVDSWGRRVKDAAGFPAFALVNKATKHALKHGDKEWDQIYLADYNHDKAEEAVLWTLSADVGNGYQCLRPVNNIHLNMDAKAADGHVGGIRDGNELILFEWKKQSNQKWKLQPPQCKVGFSARERETGKNIIVDSGFSLLNKDRSIISQSVPVKLCGICFEESSDMFEGSFCFCRFCEACMTRYIQSMLEQRRHQIYCPHETCREALTLDECRYFLPAEIFEQWSAVMVEAEIPEALKVYCPFSDCSGLLVKESVGTLDVEEVETAECPFCNRLFCARCKVPWHANLQCSEFQSLPTTDKTEADVLLLKLAEDHKWRRCGKCKSMVELIYGCNHITCRCQHEFCYVCGTSWRNGSPDCNCPRTTVDRLIR